VVEREDMTPNERATRASATEAARVDASTQLYDVAKAEMLDGRYELGAVIGRGATGVVCHGRDHVLDRDVAIKSLYPHLVSEAESRERFLREARLAAQLQHPHAVAIHDVGTGDKPYIVMELLTGGTLADRLRERPLRSPSAVRLGRQVLAALDAAHALGIVHRDIKPANIMFTGDGVTKLVDFGIATSADQTNHTATGVVLGTLPYLAPERLRGDSATVASDVYAVGVLLYEAVTGALPFHADNPAALLLEITDADEPPTLATGHQHVEPVVAATIARALRRDPEERFASAAEMGAALLPRVATHESPRPMLPEPRTERLPTLAPGRDRRPLFAAAIVSVVLALAIIGALLARDSAGTPKSSVQAEDPTGTELDQSIQALEDAVRAP
jgi:eukaryotic-like serine/threonine-protein kinase